MDELMRYENNPLGRPIENYESMPPQPQPPEMNPIDMLRSVLIRRWRLIIAAFAAICIFGFPYIWVKMAPAYEVSGAIKVAPNLSNLLTGKSDDGGISNYLSFMNTQAKMLTSPQVIQRVADDLMDKNLSFFNKSSSDSSQNAQSQTGENSKTMEYAERLKDAVNNNVITISPARQTELIEITMRTSKPKEAGIIIDAFIRAYMAIEGQKSTQDEDQRLGILESERRALSDKLQKEREVIGQLAQEFGTASLDDRQKMMLDRVSSLLGELTKVEAQRIKAEARIESIEKGQEQTMPEEWLKKRKEFINNDPTLQELVRNSVRLEEELISSRQLMTPENPLLKQKEEFVETFKKRLEERRQELGKDFDNMVVQEVNLTAQNELINLRSELSETIAYENKLRDKLSQEDSQAIEVGRKQLKIQDVQYQLERDNQLYDTYSRRIQEMDLERKQPARISIAYTADISKIRDKRKKFTLILVVLAGCVSVGLAFLKDKIDPSLKSPEEVVKLIGVRVIGTTTSPDSVERELLPRQLTEDYQTIRANLGLLDGGGMPKKLVITSPGMRDGKTTFSVNLATSLSKSGYKVLLIDGDLRKPDIGRLLNVPRNLRRLCDVLVNGSAVDSFCAMVSPGLYILASDSQDSFDPYELLIRHQTAKMVDTFSRKYDHVIIDTPPVLAFPDALIWAKIAGSVILTSYAGHTNSFDLRETRDRLTQINVRIIGTVMNNVSVGHTYYRYGYNYYSQSGRRRAKENKNPNNLLLPSEDEKKPDDTSNKPQA